MSRMKDEPLDIQTIAPKTLLHYVKKSDLIDFMSPKLYAELESQIYARTALKPTLKEIKEVLSKNSEFIHNLRNSDAGRFAFNSYTDAVNRLTGIDRSRMTEIRRGMAEPRRRFVGCLATKLKPEDYSDCLQNYDSTIYDGIKIVPPALKQRVWENTQNIDLKNALLPSVSRGQLASIPQGLRHYISSNPQEFKQYYEERKLEMNLIRSVLRGMNADEKERLKTLYLKGQSIPREEFGSLFNPENVKKRVRGKGYGNHPANEFLFSKCFNDAQNRDILSDTASNIDIEELYD